jgi:hypothetical protein
MGFLKVYFKVIFKMSNFQGGRSMCQMNDEVWMGQNQIFS